jgi:hypothetical protein
MEAMLLEGCGCQNPTRAEILAVPLGWSATHVAAIIAFRNGRLSLNVRDESVQQHAWSLVRHAICARAWSPLARHR